MATTKEQLSAHCDKVAFAIVAVITVVLIYLVSGGEDIEKSKKDIDSAIRKIDTNGVKQDAALRPVEVADVQRELERVWFQNDFNIESFKPYSFYCQPSVLRLYKQATINESLHAPAVLDKIVYERDAAAKQVVVNLSYTLGEMANVKSVAVSIERQKTGESTWTEIAAPEFVLGDERTGLTFADKSLEPGTSYCYRIATQVDKTVVEETGVPRNWKEGSRAKQVSNVAPPEESLEKYIVPMDVQMSLFQATLATTDNVGTAYFNVRFYNYETGKIERKSMTLLKEVLDKKPAESDLVPFTPYYILWVRKNEKTQKMEAILRHWKKPGTKLTVTQGKWYPQSIELPAPWTIVTCTEGSDDTTGAEDNLPAPEPIEPESPGASSEPEPLTPPEEETITPEDPVEPEEDTGGIR